ncbi:MAG: hypothetical protein LBI80_01935 [Endomicrobium sp.]|nr:hypothetical protein [Endomicrobium sp.]
MNKVIVSSFLFILFISLELYAGGGFSKSNDGYNFKSFKREFIRKEFASIDVRGSGVIRVEDTISPGRRGKQIVFRDMHTGSNIYMDFRGKQQTIPKGSIISSSGITYHGKEWVPGIMSVQDLMDDMTISTRPGWCCCRCGCIYDK